MYFLNNQNVPSIIPTTFDVSTIDALLPDLVDSRDEQVRELLGRVQAHMDAYHNRDSQDVRADLSFVHSTLREAAQLLAEMRGDPSFSELVGELKELKKVAMRVDAANLVASSVCIVHANLGFPLERGEPALRTGLAIMDDLRVDLRQVEVHCLVQVRHEERMSTRELHAGRLALTHVPARVDSSCARTRAAQWAPSVQGV